MKRETLQTYLTDHLAGSRYAVELLERCREVYRDPPLARFFDEILVEVKEDRAILRSMLLRIGGSESRLKEAGARLVERISRMKHWELDVFTGSGLLERLELLKLGIGGKRSLWEALDAVSGDTGRFGGLDLIRLRQRAEEQHQRVEEHRLRAARAAFVPDEDELEAALHDRNVDATRGVLLDIDGTLIETNDAHARAWVEAFTDANRDISFEQVRPLMGMGGGQLVEALTGVDGASDEGRFISHRQTKHFLDRHLEACEPFDGVRDLLERLRDVGFGLTAVTSSGREELERLLEKAGVADLVDRSTSDSDVDRSKPDPSIIDSALRLSGWRPPEALLLGDTPFDVDAGMSAGVDVVAVRCGGSGRAELDGALAIYEDPADLLARWETSPFRHPSAVRNR